MLPSISLPASVAPPEQVVVLPEIPAEESASSPRRATADYVLGSSMIWVLEGESDVHILSSLTLESDAESVIRSPRRHTSSDPRRVPAGERTNALDTSSPHSRLARPRAETAFPSTMSSRLQLPERVWGHTSSPHSRPRAETAFSTMS